MPAICPSAAASSEPPPRTPPSREERIERAVRAYLGDECRPPRATDAPTLRLLEAERRALYRLDCRKLKEASGVERRFAGASVYPPSAEELKRTPDLAARWGRLPVGYRKLADLMVAMISVPQILAVVGDRGRGKTHLACGLVNAFCELRRPARYVLTPDYFNRLSQASWEDKGRVREEFASLDLLVLDEVQVRDAERQWQDNELTTLIDRRYAREKATVLLSNLTPKALAENLGESIWRRLIETGGDPIEVNWPRILEVLHGVPARVAAGGRAS